MKKFLFFLISLLAGIILFFWMIKTIGWGEIKNAFLAFTGFEGIITLFFAFSILLFGAWKFGMILRTQGHNLPLKTLLGPYLSCFSMTYLFPIMIFGGDIFMVYILKERNSVPLHKGIASAIIDRILDLTCYLMISYLGIVLFFSKAEFIPRGLATLVLGTFLVISSLVVLFYFWRFKRKSLIKLFLNTKENNQGMIIEKEVFSFFNLRNKFLYKAFGLSFLKSFITIFKYWIIVLFLGKTVSIFQSLSIFSFSWLGMALPISADLGSHDAISVFVFKSLGVGSSIGAAFAMIVRGANIILALIGIVFLVRLGLGFLNKVFLSKIDRLINNKNHEV